jgi:hypothetical protein
MKRRDITELQIQEVLHNPQQTEEIRSGRRLFQSMVSFKDGKKMYLLRIFVDIDKDPAEVVTVYRTSKIEKYWR